MDVLQILEVGFLIFHLQLNSDSFSKLEVHIRVAPVPQSDQCENYTEKDLILEVVVEAGGVTLGFCFAFSHQWK